MTNGQVTASALDEVTGDEAQICEVLQVKNPAKLNARIMGMKLSPTCGRCGGSGQYSFNQIDGSVCYGCRGSGHKTPTKRDMKGILERAIEAVEAGELEAYFKRLDDRAFVKRASKEIFDAWGNTQVAEANRLSSHMWKDEDVEGLAEIRAANKIMYDAQAKFADVQYKRESDVSGEEKARIAREAIETIKAADYDVPASVVAAIKEKEA